MHGGGGGVSGGHHGGGFGGHHHGGGFAGHHHHHQQNQSDQGGIFLPASDVQPPRTGGSWNVPRSTATRYVVFGTFLVVFLAILLIVGH